MIGGVSISWPWVTLLLAAVTVLNPVGLDFLHSAFMSNEQLSRNIARPIVLTVGCGLGALGLIEFGIRRFLIARQRRSASGA